MKISTNPASKDVKINIDNPENRSDTSSNKANPSKGDVILSAPKLTPYIIGSTAGARLVVPPEVRIAPQPWRKLKHLIIATYLSVFCCFITGAIANKYAWEARRFKDLGLVGGARQLARQSACCLYLSVVLGLVIIIALGTYIRVCRLFQDSYPSTQCLW